MFSRGLARLVGDGTHTKTPSTELEHLRHEGQSLDAASLVERGQDLLLAANLHEIAGERIDPGTLGFPYIIDRRLSQMNGVQVRDHPSPPGRGASHLARKIEFVCR